MTDPTDATQQHAADPTVPGEPGQAPAGEPAPAPATGSGPSMRVDPDRPADSGWREPAWLPPRDRTRERDRRPSTFAIVVGLIFIAVGLYYFLDRTLGIALPRIQWSSVWPVILIVLGGLILVRSFQRKP